MSQNIIGKQTLAAAGTTGNNTGTAVEVRRGNGTMIGFQFVVEAVGGTPTVTYKYQGSYDNVNFFDVPYITAATATESQATVAVTSTGASVAWLALGNIRQFRYFRVVTTANTNVTYRAELYVENG